MNIILVLQDECSGNGGNTMPTQPSLNFWKVLSKHYASSSNVFFDLYNEPDTAVLMGRGIDDDTVWDFWQHGDNINGTNYVGMQTLVDAIRQNEFNNLVFADGIATGEDIALLPKHLLTGDNIVYAIHPYMAPGEHDTVQVWDGWFGSSASAGNFPVVADEWRYDQHDASACMSNAATIIPQFLSYLRSKNIGVIGYALHPGTLIYGWNFSDPTTINEPCLTSNPPMPNMDPNSQGAGRLLMDYFATYSKQY